MEACHSGAPGAESQRFSARCTCSFHCSWLTSAFFAFSLWRFVLSAASCPAVMSFVSLRPNSRCWPRSRTLSLWASPESWVPPVLVVLLPLPMLARLWLPLFRQRPQCPRRRLRPATRWRPSLLRSASLRAASPRTRTRSRSPAPLPKRAPRAPRRSSSVASGLRGSVALAESGLVTGLGHQELAHRSRLLSCGSHASLALFMPLPPSRNLPLFASGPSAPSAPGLRGSSCHESLRPTPTTNGTLSLTHTASPHFSGGTAAAVAQPADAAGASRCARDKRPPPSAQGRQALHVEGHLTCSSCRFACLLFGVATLVGSFWACACFRGSCRFAGPWQSSPAASGFAGFARRHRRWPWGGIPFDFFEKL